MTKKYQSKLNIRVDNSLKQSLIKEAQSQGQTLSDFLRMRLTQTQPTAIYALLTQLRQTIPQVSYQSETNLILDIQRTLAQLQQLILENH